MTRMVLSEDALKTAIEVNSIRDADEFLDAFGSHVSNGRQEVCRMFRVRLVYSTVVECQRFQWLPPRFLEAASFRASQVFRCVVRRGHLKITCTQGMSSQPYGTVT